MNNQCPQLVRLSQSFLLLWLMFSGSALVAADMYTVGTSVVNITPDYPIRLNGFGNRRAESEGVSQQIYAKALAIAEHKDGGRPSAAPLVLVTLDSLGIRQSLVDEVARRLMKSHQLPAANLAVTFTHSHCTPKVNGAADNIFSQAIPGEHQRHIDRYTKQLADHVTRAAQQAISAMKPAHLEWAVGKVKFAKNRRTVGGPIDHDLPVLIVRDPDSRKPRAIYVSYACHCVTLSFNQISGDWAGYAAAMIQRQVPGAVALVSIGAGSDQNPVSGVTGDKVQIAEAQGVEIAGEVKRLLAGKLRPISGAPRSVRSQIALPLNKLPTRKELIEQTGKGRPTDRYNAKVQLRRLDDGKNLLTQIDYTIQTWSFGDSFCMTFLAGEVCVDYAHRLKRELDRERFWLNAYSNDFCCYIPSERLLTEGGYGGGAEVPYFDLPATLKPGLEQKIVAEVRRQVPKSFHVPPGTRGVPPKTPEDSLQCIRTSPDLKVVLAAAEPQIKDPVAIDFGPDGRLWVAEMNDYGRDVYENFAHTGRIRWLRDLNNDGYFETAGTYIDGLRFPTDVKAWGDGILICDAPDIILAQDENNDGKADKVTKLFSGFEVRNAQARVNSLRFGLDNWVYGACGLFGGTITSSKTGRTVDCSNRDFRIKPDTGIIEPVSGRTQQGRGRNDWGDWFGCSNGTLLRSIPSDDDYRARNPLAPPAPINVVAPNAEALKLYPPANLVTFELSGLPGRATSACGIGIYRDILLGREFLNDAFTCEPVHQSVHRIDFRPGNNGFVGRRGRGEESREFLSSTDRWFRPVQARTGPDGALWIVDMYRFVIEHPRWIPQASLAELDVYAGRGRGRIYRILPRTADDGPVKKGLEQTALLPNLAALSQHELAQRLDSSNGPMRDLAHQLLLWRGDQTPATTLRTVASQSKHPAAQIQALASLAGLQQLSAEDVLQGLRATQADVQRFATKLSEPFLSRSPEVKAEVIRLAAHKNLRLRRQVALSLGATADNAAARTIAQLLKTTESSEVRSAALNSVSTANVGQVIEELRKFSPRQYSQSTWRQLLVLAIRTGDATTLDTIVAEHLPSTNQLQLGQAADLWLAALDAMDARAANHLPANFKNTAKAQQLFERALEFVDEARRSEASRSEAEYLAAFRLLGRKFGGYSQMATSNGENKVRFSAAGRAKALAEFISPRYSFTVQKSALEAVFATAAPKTPEVVMQPYASLTSKLQTVLVDLLLGRTDGPNQLLTALEKGAVRIGSLDAGQRNKLLANPDGKVRAAAEKLLGSSTTSSRAAAVQALRAVVRQSGSVDRGRVVFRKRCSSCHRVEDHGHVVGPDLAALTNRDPLWLLSAIVDPNKDVDARYLSWTAVTNGGQILSGMIVEETATAILLRESGGKEHRIARDEIEEFRSSQKSTMPEGLERDMTQQDLSDTIAYLRRQVTPRKKFPGNEPRLVTPNENGALMLTAAAAEIRGTDIRFESQFSNVGHWHHQADSVTWRYQLPKSGEFDIYLNASCAPSSAGNQFRIDGLTDQITATVSSTGGWDRFRQHKIATTRLNSGQGTIAVRAASPLKGALFDLREVRLVPAGQAPKFVVADVTSAPLPRRPPEIAVFLLDESQAVQRRQLVIDRRPGMGPAIIQLLTVDLKAGDRAEEYRRIPWIWRVAVAVGKRNDGGEIRDLLEVSVPKAGQPLRDWQAVVIGGGLINGISQIGIPPKRRLDEILQGLPAVESVWPATLTKAVAMSDDEQIPLGTRYDALRMIALQDEATAVAQLIKYLRKDSPRQLQMGAVSGLTDVYSSDATKALIDALAFVTGRNRQLAIEGLLSTDKRATALAELIKSGQLTLTEKETQALRKHPLQVIRKRFLRSIPSL